MLFCAPLISTEEMKCANAAKTINWKECVLFANTVRSFLPTRRVILSFSAKRTEW